MRPTVARNPLGSGVTRGVGTGSYAAVAAEQPFGLVALRFRGVRYWWAGLGLAVLGPLYAAPSRSQRRRPQRRRRLPLRRRLPRHHPPRLRRPTRAARPGPIRRRRRPTTAAWAGSRPTRRPTRRRRRPTRLPIRRSSR